MQSGDRQIHYVAHFAIATTFPFPGSTPSISSNGPLNGIVRAIDSSQYGVPSSHDLYPAVLHAYDATSPATEVWNSSQAANNRDQAGAVKFHGATVANGKVYMGDTQHD